MHLHVHMMKMTKHYRVITNLSIGCTARSDEDRLDSLPCSGRISMISNRSSYTNLSVEELEQQSVNAQRQVSLLLSHTSCTHLWEANLHYLRSIPALTSISWFCLFNSNSHHCYDCLRSSSLSFSPSVCQKT